MVAPPGIDGLPDELKQLILKLLAENAEKDRVISELREEIARLKGLKGRPDIKPGKPSGMEPGSGPQPGSRGAARRWLGARAHRPGAGLGGHPRSTSMTHRFLLAADQLDGERVRFTDEQAHQLRDVLRLRAGDQVRL